MCKERARWVDNIKVIACILVVLGHFYQSMVKSDILPDDYLYNWFDSTIYCFHVPLFFICSGYLYQKYSKVRNIADWKNNVLKKLIALGIPYFVFSFATWVIKKLFSSSVNTQPEGLWKTLFKNPVPPYWYLYVLFMIFLITVTVKDHKQQIIMIILGLIVKLMRCFGFSLGLYFIDKTFDCWIWFLLGMSLAIDMIKFLNAANGIIIFVVFLMGSIVYQNEIPYKEFFRFILGLLACYSIISIVYSVYRKGIQNRYFQQCAKYTMPVFLMHTLVAATFRSVLLKLGISSALVHIVLGLFISFVGPVLAMLILERIKPLDFIVYPTRYIKIGKRS